MNPVRYIRTYAPYVIATMLLAPLFGLDTAGAQTRQIADTFTATTADMTPAGVTLRIQVTDWSDDDARAAVVSTLAREDAPGSLTRLPTLGYVWTSRGGVGYALKYAHQVPTSAGGERITVVTDRPVGAYEFRPWAVGSEPATNAAAYSVIELYLDDEGSGVGTMSLAAEIVVDADAQTVSLARGDPAINVLIDAMREPKPYWADGS